MVTINRMYVQNGKIQMDGKNSEGTMIHQIVSMPFKEDKETNKFVLEGTMEFLQDLVELLNRSLKK